MQNSLFWTLKGAAVVDQGVTEDDLKNLFGPEYKTHVESIEWNLEKLTKGLKVKTKLWHNNSRGGFKKEFRESRQRNSDECILFP